MIMRDKELKTFLGSESTDFHMIADYYVAVKHTNVCYLMQSGTSGSLECGIIIV